MFDPRPRLALTIGDPAGVGPDVAAALVSGGGPRGARILLVGAAAPLESRLPRRLRGSLRAVSADASLLPDSRECFAGIVDTGSRRAVLPGRPSAAGGRAAGRAIEIACSLARRGAVDGIVTGPVSKESLALAGYPFPGHTEMLASLLNAPRCQMMMVHRSLRVVILTRHLPLHAVPRAVTGEAIRTAVRVTSEALGRFFGITAPRIAVAALNPHAGDGGVIGDEEDRVMRPAIRSLRRAGHDVEGPFSADTLFYNWRQKGYDAYIAAYHDQGMIPFKMAGFDRGVNMTIGLPVVRTSVAHGTGFDIAATGAASPASIEAAVALAIRCCRAARGTGR